MNTPKMTPASAGLAKMPTGIKGFDEITSGGLPRNRTSLIIGGPGCGKTVFALQSLVNGARQWGAPGTAKSTLSAAFAEAACRRGEKTLYGSFDESASELVRNLSSVGIRLSPHIESGVLRVYSERSEPRSTEEHLMRIKALIREQKPRCLVIDPLSAMVKAGGRIPALGVAKEVLRSAKADVITIVLTSLIEGADPLVEASEIAISTIADTWIHLAFVAQGGERNRALTIVKSRGTRHSNQVRELLVSDEGVTLMDVYTAEGEVLMGSLR